MFGTATERQHATPPRRADELVDITCRTTRDAWCDLEISGATAPRCGQATPPLAAHFRRTQGIDLPVLADAERLTYKAAGAKVATMHELLGPLVVANGVIAIAKHGVFQVRTIGDFAQLLPLPRA